MNINEYTKMLLKKPNDLSKLLDWLTSLNPSINYALTVDRQTRYRVVLLNNKRGYNLTLEGNFAYIYAALDGICEYEVKHQDVYGENN